jgi:hypothetical protein
MIGLIDLLIILQHHISKLSMSFWSTAQSVQVSAPYKAVLQMQNFTSFFLNSKSNFAGKKNPKNYSSNIMC